MTIKLLLLKSGEDIISDIKEMVVGEDEDRRVVGYFLNKPCLVKMRDPSLLTEESTEEQKKAAYQVSLYPWMPLSKDYVIPVAADWVVTIVEPIVKLSEMYVEDVLSRGTENNQDTSTTEQSNSNNTD
ncbi:MAG: hypothetical protein EBU90_02940 [Proteobacteria bacterium]|nr:hypothetical protein [Pseudomonadota bacterium]